MRQHSDGWNAVGLALVVLIAAAIGALFAVAITFTIRCYLGLPI